MTIKTFSCLLLILPLLLTGCSRSSGIRPEPSESTSASASPLRTDIPASRPAGPPLNVLVYVSDIVLEETIGAEGGSITMAGEDGSYYTLILPPGALTEDHVITLRPITSIQDFPFSGGLLIGVDIQPDGLSLFKPARLILRPARLGSLTELLQPESLHRPAGFGYRKAGEDFHLMPMEVLGDEIHFSLTRFSGYGTGGATSEDIIRQGERIPSDAKAHALQEIDKILTEYAGRLNEERDEHWFTSEEAQQLLRIFEKWFYNEIQPILAEAEHNDRKFFCAGQAYYGWLSQLFLLGFEPPPPFEKEMALAQASLERILLNAAKAAHQRAVSNKDPSEVNRLAGILATSMAIDINFEPIVALLNKTTRFELEFESVIRQASYWEIGVKTGKIPLELHESMAWYTGSGTLQHTFAWMECMSKFSSQPGQAFTIEAAYIKLPMPEPFECEIDDRKNIPTPNVLMLLNPGYLMEQFTIQCSADDIAINLMAAPMWYGSFGFLHEASLQPETGLFIIGDWEIGEGELFAVKRFRQTFEDLTEETSLFLWYTPLP